MFDPLMHRRLFAETPARFKASRQEVGSGLWHVIKYFSSRRQSLGVVDPSIDGLCSPTE